MEFNSVRKIRGTNGFVEPFNVCDTLIFLYIFCIERERNERENHVLIFSIEPSSKVSHSFYIQVSCSLLVSWYAEMNLARLSWGEVRV